VRLLVSRPTPNLEDQGIPLRVAPTPWPVRHGCLYQQLRYRRHSSQGALNITCRYQFALLRGPSKNVVSTNSFVSRFVLGRCSVRIKAGTPLSLTFSWFSSAPSVKYWDSASVRSRHFNSKSFLIHLSSSHSALHSFDTEKVYLSNPQKKEQFYSFKKFPGAVFLLVETGHHNHHSPRLFWSINNTSIEIHPPYPHRPWRWRHHESPKHQYTACIYKV
jgi:hypothetical protein